VWGRRIRRRREKMKRVLITMALSAIALLALGVLVLPAAHAQVTEEWVARYNDPANGSDAAVAAAVDPVTGNVYVTGGSYAGIFTGFDYATVAYDSNGNLLWAKTYDGPVIGHALYANDRAVAIAADPSTGNVYVTGWSDRGIGTPQDYATVAYDASGNQLWVARYDGPANGVDLAAGYIAVDPSTGTVYVTGQSDGGSGTSDDYATVAYRASDGHQLWVKRYDGPGNGDDSARAIAVDPSAGNVYVTGASSGSGTSLDYATVAYRASDGHQLWVARYDGPGNFIDDAQAIAVGPSTGNVYVTGGSDGIGTSSDYATVAYRASDGHQLWVKRYDGPGNGGDGAKFMAADPSTGNIYVTGDSDGGIVTGLDQATVAYDSSGNELWVARYDGPVSGGDFIKAMAADPSTGNVYVTGGSDGSGTDLDYATVAYDASGSELWVARYNGPGNGYDVAFGMAADPSTGNVYVTGESDGSGTGRDYATIKYSFSPAYQFVGFFSPLENPPVVNTAKAGRTIPVKWQIIDEGGSYISDLAAVTGISYQETTCGGTLENAVYETDTSGSSGLRYEHDGLL
jgi:hypothetical protein